MCVLKYSYMFWREQRGGVIFQNSSIYIKIFYFRLKIRNVIYLVEESRNNNILI